MYQPDAGDDYDYGAEFAPIECPNERGYHKYIARICKEQPTDDTNEGRNFNHCLSMKSLVSI